MLRLKKGVPMMLLRNIDQTIGHCNSTHFFIVELGINIIGTKIVWNDFNIMFWYLWWKTDYVPLIIVKKICMLYYLGLIYFH